MSAALLRKGRVSFVTCSASRTSPLRNELVSLGRARYNSAMADRWVEMGSGFWNIRGSMRLAGLIDLGTQMSVVRRASGKFILLDSYTPDVATRQRLLELTDGGRAVEAILNLHPFHTLHVANVAALLPNAKLYGTTRHVARAPQLSWEPIRTESTALGELFGDDLRFSVPRGVDFICADERQHFASVLAFHPTSGTLHVDDTLMWLALPLLGGLRFHPSLARVLQHRPEAVAEFRRWLVELRELFTEVRAVCAAHMRPLSPIDGQLQTRLEQAISKIEPVLVKHERRFK